MKNRVIWILIINLIIAAGYLADGRGANATHVSGDMANILPIVFKSEDPELYPRDTYLEDANNTRYYAPFFITMLKGFYTLAQGDIFIALNWLSCITHLIYGVLWFFLFYRIRPDFWAALLFSLICRGILWPPGAELLGISDLWTIMPRTFFGALAPLPFLIYRTDIKGKLYYAALTLGIISNFHPISGIGAILVYGTLLVGYDYNRHGRWLVRDMKKWLKALGYCLIGLAPFIWNYISSVLVKAPVNTELMALALAERLPKLFFDPIEFVQLWIRPSALAFAAVFLLFCIWDSSDKKRYAKLLALAIVVVLLVANLLVYVEQGINSILGTSFTLSFQLIRIQKYVFVLMQIGGFLLLCELFRRLKAAQSTKALLTCVMIALLMWCKKDTFRSVPLLGDDICRSILPYSLSFATKTLNQNQVNHQLMLDYIKKIVPENGLLFGDPLVRLGSKRSVWLDHKGAAMLIEGNSKEFIRWYQNTKQYNALDAEGRVLFLKENGVTHMLFTEDYPLNTLKPIKIIGNYRLYDITRFGEIE